MAHNCMVIGPSRACSVAFPAVTDVELASLELLVAVVARATRLQGAHWPRVPALSTLPLAEEGPALCIARLT